MIKEFLNKFRTGFREKEPRAVKEWKILLAVFFGLLVVVFLANIYLFLGFKKSLEKDVLIKFSDSRFIQRTALKEVINELEKKEGKFSENLTSPPQVFDPS